MSRIIEITARLFRASQKAYGRKWSFLAVFMLVLISSITLLGRMGLLPEGPKAEAVAASTTPPVSVTPSLPELPLRVESPDIGLSVTIANPTTTAIPVLDEALKHGAVRYPTSAQLGENGNVVLFAHSSYLPIVLNPAYKTFNGIQKLTAGETVTVYSSGTAYTYRVKSVSKESANDAGIPLAVAGRVLTLSTCDSFGKKTDRFVVVADFVESHTLQER